MKLSVIYQPTVPASTSPYRVRDEQGRELDWANAFLDGQRIRQLSACSLRIYAYDLLDFARWFEPQHQPLAEITESTSSGCGALLLSLPHRSRDCRRPSAFPASLCPTIPPRLRPASHRRRSGTSPQTRAPDHRAALRRRSRQVLAKLPHLPRSRTGRADAPRRLALL